MTTENHLLEQVRSAISQRTPLYIQGGNSKAFYGNTVDTTLLLDTTSHTGVVDYMPSELCITVRAGTRLQDLEYILASEQQLLPFEPPVYTSASTIGGAVAAGLSGPRRPYSGAVRDAILGMKILTGHGTIIHVGGQVMKNVAGYDISRLMTGSLGTLGVILEVSLRVIPKPAHELTLAISRPHDEAINYFTRLRTSGLPITASCYLNDEIHLRLSGSTSYLQSLVKKQEGQVIEKADAFWQSIRNHTHDFFQQHDKPLWRLSVAPASTASARLNTDNLIEWGGGVRWISSNTPANIIHSIARKKGGYAVLFRGKIAGVNTFPEPEPALLALHKRLKHKLDPQPVFNPGRLYREL